MPEKVDDDGPWASSTVKDEREKKAFTWEAPVEEGEAVAAVETATNPEPIDGLCPSTTPKKGKKKKKASVWEE